MFSISVVVVLCVVKLVLVMMLRIAVKSIVIIVVLVLTVVAPFEPLVYGVRRRYCVRRYSRCCVCFLVCGVTNGRIAHDRTNDRCVYMNTL